MSDDKKSTNPIKDPAGWLARSSLLALIAVIALNLAIAFLQPVLPWLLGGAFLTATAWVAIRIARYRRSKW